MRYVLPARSSLPRDKPKVEVAVLLLKRWTLVHLRNRCFFSLVELKRGIAELLADLNQRHFKKLLGSRPSAFEHVNAPVLQPLPTQRLRLSRWKTANLNIDCHLKVDDHCHGVPRRLNSLPALDPCGSGLAEPHRGDRLVSELRLELPARLLRQTANVSRVA